MINVVDFSIISKEVLTILAYCDESIIRKIPSSFFKELVEYAADSKEDCFIDPNKTLDKQNISEKSKDLLALIYYSYIADDTVKNKLKHSWDINEKKYQEELKKIYNTDNLFNKKTAVNSENVQLIKYEKENLITKIINKIKSIFSGK